MRTRPIRSYIFKVVLKREPDLEYHVDALGEDFIIRTNWQAPNFRIMRAPVLHSADKSSWQDVVAHRPDVLLEGFEVSRRYLAINEHSAGL